MTPTLSDLSVLQVLVLLLPVLIPLAVDAVTKASAPDWLKSGLALFLACLTGAVQAAVVSDGETWQTYVSGILYSALIAFVAHYTGISNGVERRTARFGITSKRTERQRAELRRYDAQARPSAGSVSVSVTADLTHFADALEQAATAVRATLPRPQV